MNSICGLNVVKVSCCGLCALLERLRYVMQIFIFDNFTNAFYARQLAILTKIVCSIATLSV